MRGTLLVLVGSLAVVGACGDSTGIRVDVTMSSALQGKISDGLTFDTLRIYVGHTTTDATQFTSSDDAFLSQPSDKDKLLPGFRYLLAPEGALADVGDVMVAAAVGNTRAGQMFDVVGFAASPVPIGFADGVVRVVSLDLQPDTDASPGVDDECIRWQQSQIAPPDDLDCDGAVGTADCNDRDPSMNRLDSDGDGVTSCDGDCMEQPDSNLPWVDPRDVNPRSTLEGQNQNAVCVHVDYNCDGRCGTQHDDDGSGAGVCGKVAVNNHLCNVTPADCVEGALPVNNASSSGVGEACNGADDACDGFLQPDAPCTYRDSNQACHVGKMSCDENEGEFAGERVSALDCKPLSVFSNFTLSESQCGLDTTQSCLESPDVVGCETEGLTVPRISCTADVHGTGGTCAPDRRPLAPPSPTTSCVWQVVGGIQQAEWQIGFVDPLSTPDTVPMAATTMCSPHLAIRSMSPVPVARTVLLLFGSPGTGNTAMQLIPVRVQPGSNVCDGVLDCTSTLPALLPPLG